MTRLTLSKLGSGVLVAAVALLTLSAFRQDAQAGGILGPDPRGTLVDGVLALLIGWLLTRSFSLERSTSRTLTDQREHIGKLIAELERNLTAQIVQSRLEVADLRGRVMEIDKRLDAHRLEMNLLGDKRDADREAERDARHDLANKITVDQGELDLRVRDLAERLASIEAQTERRKR